MSVNTVKEVRIKNTGGTYDIQPIGAEGQYIDISRDANGNIIEDITAAGVVVDSTEGLAETLKNIEESIAGSNEFSEMTDVDFTSLTDKNLVQYDSTAAKWKNVAMDSTPTANSNKPVTSGGIKTALDLKTNDADLKAIAKSGDASDVNYTNTTSGLAATKVQAAIDEVAAENQTLTNQVKDMNNVYGAKNLLPNTATTQTLNGVTFIVNDDGSVTANGTATGDLTTWFYILGEDKKTVMFPNIVGKTVKLTGCPSGGGLGVYLIRFFERTPTSITHSDYGDGITFTVQDNLTGCNCAIGINPGVTVSNLTFKPMLRFESIEDDTYEPYAKTNQQLTDDVKNTGAIEPMLNVLGAKNLLPNNLSSRTIAGITFTVNSDGSVTANGTATATAYVEIYINSSANLKLNTSYIASGCPQGGGSSTYYVTARDVTDAKNVAIDYGNGSEPFFMPNLTNTINLRLVVVNGQTVSNLVFKPMIRLASIEDDTYVPYAKTNRELTEKTASIESDISAINAQLNFDGAGAHNSIYRGKYLGAEVTAEQYAHIADGTFKDMYIGDYWTINGVNYRIGHFDYWLRTGDTACTIHHVLIVTDGYLTNGKMNSTLTTEGGYAGSDLKTGANDNTLLATAKNTITTAFGSAHILTHREYFTNAVANGKPSAGAWYDSDIDLMNENMVYGTNIFLSHSDGSTVPKLHTIDKTQIKLFAERPDLITIRVAWWLRDVVSATHFAVVSYEGNADIGGAMYNYNVRPAFAIRA